MKKSLFYLFLILVLIAFTYRDFPNTFFQQDEWSTFGRFIYRQSVGFNEALGEFLFVPGMAHFTPLTSLVHQWQFKLWGLNFAGYAYFSLFLHFLNSLLVFYFAWLLFQKKGLALISALLFSVNSISHQAVIWISASVGTQGSSFFLLLSLILLIHSFREKKNSFFIFSLVALSISLLFKEISIFFFLLIPFVFFFFGKKEDLFSKKKAFPFLGLILSYSILRIFLFQLSKLNTIRKTTEVIGWDVYTYRLVTLPLKAMVQSFIPADFILKLSQFWIATAHPYFESQKGTTNYDLVSQTVFADLASYILLVFTFIIFLLVYKLLKKSKKKRLKKLFIFSIVFTMASSLPFVFIPGQVGYFTFFEPRNLYLPAVGASLLLALAIFVFTQRWGRKTWLFFLIPLLFLHIQKIRQDMELLVARGEIRKSILDQIKGSYPQLPKRVVFYTESDAVYHGLPPEEKILPFQSGLGQTLLVWYYESEKFPPCLYQDVFLYEITSQGYRSCQGRGFGYFRKYEDLVAGLKENGLQPESVYAFEWQKKKGELFNITPQVRQRLTSILRKL